MWRVRSRGKLWIYRGIVTLAVPVLAGLLPWLVVGESSPLHRYFLHRVMYKNVVYDLFAPAIIIGAMLSGNVHGGDAWAYCTGLLSEWLPVGFLISVLILRRSRSSMAG